MAGCLPLIDEGWFHPKRQGDHGGPLFPGAQNCKRTGAGRGT